MPNRCFGCLSLPALNAWATSMMPAFDKGFMFGAKPQGTVLSRDSRTLMGAIGKYLQGTSLSMKLQEL